jgi:hypothetical protein
MEVQTPREFSGGHGDVGCYGWMSMNMEPDSAPSESKKRLQSLAIVSLVLWFLGLCATVVVWLPIDAMEHLEDQTIEGIYVCVGIFAWIPSIFCSHVSLSRIRKSTVYSGKGIAYTSLTLSYVALSLLMVVSAYVVIMGAGDGK